MKRILSLALILLSGCATSYHPNSFSGGYTETQLAENIWRVSFEGNGYTRQQRAEDFALLRCAEVTLEKGFTHFALANSASRTDFSSASTSSTTRYRGNRSTTTSDTDIIVKPSTTNVVVMFNSKPDNQMAYDAKMICGDLGRKYEVTCLQNH